MAKIVDLQKLTINSLGELVEFQDVSTGGHISRTRKYVEQLINCMLECNIYSEELLSWEHMEYVAPATKLHDLGKIFISNAILNKAGPLTPEELEIMKTHAALGVEAIDRLEEGGRRQTFLRYARIAAGTHHEKWDGSGYPDGLKGLDIPLLGRLAAIADAYDALTSYRPYKEPLNTDKAAGIIIASAGSHFEPVLVDVFKKVVDRLAAIAQNSGRDRLGIKLDARWCKKQRSVFYYFPW